ncbi:hypothetical protein METP2_03038 [Methanosarcinales archaeon]|nr:hypothetical protein METP2_03038 [Methanosarcinales archaeon]
MTPNAYSALDRFLHRLVLRSRNIQKISLDVQLSTYKGKFLANEEIQPVFVCGLARSGTTTLLRLLYQTGVFNTITYRDMPFVLMPTVWSKISKLFQRKSEPTERAHGDGILVGFDSPESFESVFWDNICNHNHLYGKTVGVHQPSAAEMRLFGQYIQTLNIANEHTDSHRRYLSKNNNNLVRLNALNNSFPKSSVLLMYRNPIQTALSLHRQHIQFCKQQKQDPFVLEYMSLLKHFEFGMDHRPFIFEGSVNPTTTNISNLQDAASTPLYWLKYWTHVYQYVIEALTQGLTQVHLVHYEALCRQPESQLARIFDKTSIYLGENSRMRLAEQIKLAQPHNHDLIRQGCSDEIAINEAIRQAGLTYEKLQQLTH